jgi:MFS superfamily sulfate permease-like transporter
MIVTFIEGVIVGICFSIGLFTLLKNCYEGSNEFRNENGNKSEE